MIIAGSGTTRDEFGVTSPVLELLCSQRCDSPSRDPCWLHLPFPRNKTKKKNKKSGWNEGCDGEVKNKCVEPVLQQLSVFAPAFLSAKKASCNDVGQGVL